MVQLLAGRTVELPPDGVKAAGGSWLSLPISVHMASSRSGNFYFSDHCTIRKVGADGNLSTVAGTGNCGSTVPKTLGPGIDLPFVYTLAVDSHDNIFAGLNFGTSAGLYSLATGGAFSLVPGLTFPSAIAMDSKDRLYVVGYFGGLSPVDPDGTLETLNWINGLIYGSIQGFSPAISIDSADNVYILTPYDPYTDVVYRFTPDGLGNPVARLQLPNPGFAVDALGAVWYVELLNLELVQPSSAPLVMSALCCGYSGDGSAVVGAQFQPFPGANLTNDASGNIYVLDAGNAVIRKISGAPAAQAPVISPGGIVNAASLLGGAIAPGELISIFGSNFLEFRTATQRC
jgi:hypothetical protein